MSYSAKNRNIICSIIVALAILFGIVSLIGAIVSSGEAALKQILNLIIYALIIYFCFWGYKVPNGKMLKWVFVLFALVTTMSAPNIMYGKGFTLRSAASFLICGAGVLSAYMGGRLPRVKENRRLSAVIIGLLLIAIIPNLFSSHVMLSDINMLIQASALIGAYHTRAAQYKENSGILDDK